MLLQGILVTLAIGLHNVPEGLATATVLVARGIPASRAFWWTLATSLPQPLLALPSFVFVDAFSSLLPLALGFAAGCMVWMVFAELLPDALADAPHTEVHATSLAVIFSCACPAVLGPGKHCEPACVTKSSVQVATAATMSAAGLEAMRMALFLLEQSATSSKDGTSMDQAAFLVAGMLFIAALPALLAGVAAQKMQLLLAGDNVNSWSHSHRHTCPVQEP